MYKLTFWLKSKNLETSKTIIDSGDLDSLMNQIGTCNDNGEAWLLHVDKDVYVGGLFIANPEIEDLIVNAGWFTVGESEEYRGDLTNKIKASRIYKEKGIDKTRDKFIIKYDEKGLKPTK